MYNSEQIDKCIDEASKAASDEARARMEQIMEAASRDGARGCYFASGDIHWVSLLSGFAGGAMIVSGLAQLVCS